MILITGGCGFIGGFIARYLAERGRDVLVFDRNITPCSKIPDKSGATRVEGDLSDRGRLKSIFRDYRPRVVIHTAWEGMTSQTRNAPGQIENLAATNNLLKICAEQGCELFIGFGSQAEYGVHNVRINEDTIPHPHTFYGAYKLAAGLIGRLYAAAHGFGYAWLRLFSAYGPTMNQNYILPYVINSFLRNSSPSLTRCEQRWDYLYVKDIPPLVEKVIDSGAHSCDIYNLCSGSSCLMKEIVLTIQAITGASAEPGFGDIPYRKEGLFFLEGDNSKFIDAFGWTELTSMGEGLKETVEWFRRRPTRDDG